MLLICIGTRPEYIKLRPLIPYLDKENIPYKLIYVKQHTDLMPELPSHQEIEIDDISDNRLDNVLLNVVDKAKDWLEGADSVLVQGDTQTALAASVAAFNRGIKIIHLEAGLRTFNRFNPYPEEMIRGCISRMADVHLCPTKGNAQNLIKEGIRADKYIVGNTVLNSIDSSIIPEENIVFITLHRRENIPIMDSWFVELNKLADIVGSLRFVFPMHPNPNIQKHRHLLSNVEIIPPLSREDTISYIKKSKLIISDSGGIQEETNFLHKKLIICRKVTERQECIWTNGTMCKSPDYLKTAFFKIINKKLDDYTCPYYNPESPKIIVEIIKDHLNKHR